MKFDLSSVLKFIVTFGIARKSETKTVIAIHLCSFWTDGEHGLSCIFQFSKKNSGERALSPAVQVT